jgi:predicted O-linked N-acetylglucosamine transferase (SPINDLY family)
MNAPATPGSSVAGVAGGPSAQARLALVRQWRSQGQLERAQALCQQLLSRQPALGAAWHELGLIDRAAGRHGLAVQRFAQAARHAPSDAVLADLGTALLATREHERAAAIWQELVVRSPHAASHHANQGVALARLGRLGEAVACYRRALALDPALPGVRSNLASALRNLGDPEGLALQEYERALEAAPHDHRLRSNWLYASSHQRDLSPAELYRRHRSFGLALAGVPRLPEVRPDPAQASRRRLRIGFVSADLRNHAVAFFIKPVWQTIDRSRFEVWVYANSPVQDATTSALRALSDAWCEVHALNDEALAARIRADGIDVLVDLSGHTAGNRLPVFARKPAPVQASWIGYPCSTGLPAIDYLFTDAFMAPPGAVDAGFAEKLVRLPAAVCFQPPAWAPEVGPLPALARGHITFGSFHRPAKLSDRALARWAAVLQAVPGAVLLLGPCDDAEMQARLLARFQAHGIGAERLRPHPRLPLADYLALHGEIDLMLDACEFSGGTTSAHALWMGVPVLAVAGEAMPARQSAAILHHLGLGDFIAADEQGFVARAVAWAAAREELASIRTTLRQRIRALPLLREHLVTRGFERAVACAWQRWRDGLPAAALTVSADAARCGVHEPVPTS